jgi:Kef-type K+ transport system membrane component KefB
MVSKFNKTTSEITRVLSIIAPSGQLVAITLLGFCLAMARSDVSATALHISLGEWIIATLTSGILCGLLFSLFIGKQSDSNRTLLAALGVIIFAAGIGTLLSVSALFVCFVTGLTISVFSSYADNLKKNLVSVEEPIFVLLLVIGGASWHPEINRAWLLPAVYFLVRALSFSLLAQNIHQRMTKRKLSRLGQGLLGQDLVAVAIALSLAKEFPELKQLFLTTILGSIFLNDIIANSLLKKVILDNEQAIELKPIATTKEVNP